MSHAHFSSNRALAWNSWKQPFLGTSKQPSHVTLPEINLSCQPGFTRILTSITSYLGFSLRVRRVWVWQEKHGCCNLKVAKDEKGVQETLPSPFFPCNKDSQRDKRGKQVIQNILL
jgi:hypothetical protein